MLISDGRVGQREFIDSEIICYETAISESTCYEFMVVKEFLFVLVLYDNFN